MSANEIEGFRARAGDRAGPAGSLRWRCGRARRVRAFAAGCLALALGAAGASADEGEELDPLFDEGFDAELEAAPESYPDPLESTNRGVLAFNRQVDKWILDPVTEAYQFVVPKPARNAVSRFFLNLGSTKTLVNDCLQLEWKDAAVTGSRLVLNTAFGFAGFFDVAESIGLPGHESDFGQTLALAGTPSGPYLVLPILGPSNLRDGTGSIVDGFFQPTYYILGPMNVTLGPVLMNSPGAVLIYGGSSGLTLRDRNYAKLKDLESSSVDYYAAMRSGFYQDRVGQIWGRRALHRATHEPGEDAPLHMEPALAPEIDPEIETEPAPDPAPDPVP